MAEDSCSKNRFWLAEALRSIHFVLLVERYAESIQVFRMVLQWPGAETYSKLAERQQKMFNTFTGLQFRCHPVVRMVSQRFVDMKEIGRHAVITIMFVQISHCWVTGVSKIVRS
jgi:hypothetical protein